MQITKLQNQIKTYRLNQNLTAKEVARQAGISHCHYNRFENGGRTLSLATFLKVLEVLHIDLELHLQQAHKTEYLARYYGNDVLHNIAAKSLHNVGDR